MATIKKCTTCLEEKETCLFTKDKSKKDGYYSKCKSCCIIKTQSFYDNHPGYKREQDKKYYQNNKSAIIKQTTQYSIIRYNNDLNFKLKKDISKRVNTELKKQGFSKNNKSILKFLSYSIQELKEHLEKQFEPWMNWNNQGTYRLNTWDDNDQNTWTWQIDHIIPHSTFKYTSMEDDNFKKCWSLDNLRPLSAKQNLLDRDRS